MLPRARARSLTVLALALSLAATLPVVAQDVERRTVNDGNMVLEAIPPVPEALAEKLARYENVRSANFLDWTADGASLYISTRFGDTSQLHRVEGPGGARHQLTFYPEPVRGVTRRPGSDELVFSMDEGGSEFYQLFLLDPATGDHERLTDGSSRNQSPSWSRDGKQLAFTSTRRNGRSNDVWVMNPEHPASARLVFEAPDGTWWGPSDWSPDGSQLLVVNYISVTDSRIHLIDMTTGSSRLVAGGADNPGNHSRISPQFTADGQGFFLATDEAGEFAQLAHQDIESDHRRLLTTEIPWDVEGLVLSEDGSRGVFLVNDNGMSRPYLFDPSSLGYEPVVGLPAGRIQGGAFSPDGRRFALTLNSPTTPSDVFVLRLDSDVHDLVRWTWSEVGGLDTSTFVEPGLVTFPTFDSVDGVARNIPAFVYKPRGEGPHPVIIAIHGGPEAQYRPTFSSTYQMWVAELGAAVIAPNVRGSSGYGKTYVKLDNGMLREDSVKDIGALLDWIDEQPDLDSSRVAVYGGSYGGYMVLASAVHYSDRLAAAVDIVGISNFVTFLENTQDYRRDLRRPEYGDERDPEMRAHLESISPNRHADKIKVPLLVAQGQNDPRVPVTEAEQIVRDVRSNGREVWYMNALNEGHGFRKKENRDLYYQVVSMFFERHLIGDNAP